MRFTLVGSLLPHLVVSLLLLASLSGCGISSPPRIARETSVQCIGIEECQDTLLQAKLDAAVEELGLSQAAFQHRLSIQLVDITNLDAVRTAGVNQEYMMYAASLPKIAILFGLLKRVEQGSLSWDGRTHELAARMIRVSSNSAASELFHLVGPGYLAALLRSARYNLYSAAQGGGLWVGKEYGSGPAWQRDPLKHLSHAATARSVARLYYLLETGQLLAPEQAALMKDILSSSALHHKFVKGLAEHAGVVPVSRKSGSWGTFHSDSAVVEHNGRRYIAVALTDDPDGIYWLENLIVKMDELIAGRSGNSGYLETTAAPRPARPPLSS